MTKFKKGDKVKCIESPVSYRKDRYVDSIVTVLEVNGDGKILNIEEWKDIHFHNNDWFELVTPKSPPTIIDLDHLEHGNSKGALDAPEKLRDEDREKWCCDCGNKIHFPVSDDENGKCIAGGTHHEKSKYMNEPLVEVNIQKKSVEDTSDGYHTFKELYEFRKLYNACLFNEWYKQGKYNVHKSYKHSDGEECFGGGWFVVQATLPAGQITNHYKNSDWALFTCEERRKADKWDGHSAQDVTKRLIKHITTPDHE